MLSEILSYIQELKNSFQIREISGFQDQSLNEESSLDGYCKIYFTNINSKEKRSEKITQSPHLEKILSPNELQILHTFKKGFRKSEWFYGRLLAKLAILECLLKLKFKALKINKIEIVLGSSNKPQFKMDDNVVNSKDLSKIPIHFSISHKEGKIVATATIQRPVGIDIEKIQDFSVTLTKNILKNSDLGEFVSFLKLNQLNTTKNFINTGLWCIKEATTKAIGLGLKVDFKILSVKFENDKLFVIHHRNGEDEKYFAKILSYNEYIIALVMKSN